MAEAAVRQSLADRSLQLDGLIEAEINKEWREVSEEDTYLFVERMATYLFLNCSNRILARTFTFSRYSV